MPYEISGEGTVTLRNDNGIIGQFEGQNITISDNNERRLSLSEAMSRREINNIYGWFGNSFEGNIKNLEKRYIQQFNYIPEQFVFHKTGNEEELYLGVELEIDVGGDTEENAEYVYNLMNVNTENVYCKHDGSLTNGFEIVTHPCTIEYHKQLSYDILFKELIQRGYRSHDVQSCGLHVHINRDYFGQTKLEQDLNISKLLYLYEKYWDKVELVARRKSNRYAKRFLLEEDETPLDLYAKSKESDKYGAINLQHKNTVEIRIFKGTLKVDTYLNTLEFVKVMVNIAKESDIYNIQFVTWDKIKSRFSDELNQYILDREETVKKEDRENVNSALSSREQTLRYSAISAPTQSFYDGHGMYRSFETGLDLSSAAQRRAYDELLRSSLTSISSMPSLELYSDRANRPVERSSEEMLLEQIQDLRARVRRSRNGLEITNLNRQIADLETQLRVLRRSR